MLAFLVTQPGQTLSKDDGPFQVLAVAPHDETKVLNVPGGCRCEMEPPSSPSVETP